MASKRGGGSAPAHCKKGLSNCMTSQVRGGKTFRSAAKSCMINFNTCRGVGKGRRKATKSKRRGRR